MLAAIKPSEDGYEARFERRLKHPVEKVWSFLTENDKLKRWFSELRVDDLREGGVIKFDMQDGTFEEMKILELRLHSVLEYTWGDDQVRFELYPEPDGGSRLVLIEKIRRLTDHSPKDLAGWHVCLDVVEALLDDRTFESREQAWERRHKEYERAVAQLRNE